MAISFKLLQRPPAAYRGRGHQTCQPTKNSVGRIHMASGSSSDQLSVESVSTVNQVHTQTSKYFIDQYRMIVLLRRKIIQSKNNSFSKERNKSTEQMILNANVHFVLSRLKFSRNTNASAFNWRKPRSNQVAPCKNVPAACKEFI